MARVPGTNKFEYEYGGYKTDQDPFLLKKGDKPFSGPQVEIKSQRARVFIAGYDVTPDILSIDVQQEREGQMSCSLSLANPRHKYIVTKEDLLLYFDNVSAAGPVLKNSNFLPTYGFAQAGVSLEGGGAPPTAPIKDFGHPNSDTMKNIYQSEVNDVYQRETPASVNPEMTLKEMLWKVKRHSGIFKFENDLIFDYKEPIVVFFQGRFSPLWYFGFSGFLTGFNYNYEYGGSPAIEISGSSKKYQFSLDTEVTSPALAQEYSQEGKNVNNRSDASFNNVLKNFINGKSLKEAIINLFLKFVQDERLGGLPPVPVNYWEPNYVTFFEDVLGTNDSKDNYALKLSKQKFFETTFPVLLDAVRGLWSRITKHIGDPDKGDGAFEVNTDVPELLCATEVKTKQFYDSIKFERVPNNTEDIPNSQKEKAETVAKTGLTVPPPRNPGDPLNSNYSQILGDSIFQVNIFTVKPYTTTNVHSIYDSNMVRLWESDFKFDKDKCSWESGESVAAIGMHPALTEDFINKFHILPKIYAITRDNSTAKPKRIPIGNPPKKEPSVVQSGDTLPLKFGVKNSQYYLQGESALGTNAQQEILDQIEARAKEMLDKYESVDGFKIKIIAHDDIARWVPRGFLTKERNPKNNLAQHLTFEKRWFGKYNNTGAADESLIPTAIISQFKKFVALDNYDGDVNDENPFKIREKHFYISEENFEADKLLSYTRAAGVAEFLARIIQVVDAVDSDTGRIPADKLDPTKRFLKSWNDLDTKPIATTGSKPPIYRTDGSRLGLLKGPQTVVTKLKNLVTLKKQRPQVWEKLKEAIGYEIADAKYSLAANSQGVTVVGMGWAEPNYQITDRLEDLRRATQQFCRLVGWTTRRPVKVGGRVIRVPDSSSANNLIDRIDPAISKSRYRTEEDLKAALKTFEYSKESYISSASKEGGNGAKYSTIAVQDIDHVLAVLIGEGGYTTRFGITSDPEEYRNRIIRILASDLTKSGRESNRRFEAEIEAINPKAKIKEEPKTDEIPQFKEEVVICIERASRSPYDKLKEQVFGVPTEANPKVTGFNLHRPKFILMLPPLYMSSTHPLTSQFRQFFIFENEVASIASLLDSIKEHMQFNYYETPMGDIVFEPYNYDMNPSQQVTSYLNIPTGDLSENDEFVIEGESFFALPEDNFEDPSGEKMTYLPVPPTYISMKYAPKKLHQNRLPIVAPKRYFRHPYYFSDIDEKSIGFNFQPENIYSRIIVTGNSVGGIAGSFSPLADRAKLEQIRLFGRLQAGSERRDLLAEPIPIGIYVADGFESDVLDLDDNIYVTGLVSQMRAKSEALQRSILTGNEKNFAAIMKSMARGEGARIGSTIQQFINNNLIELANAEITRKNAEIKKSNEDRKAKAKKDNPADDIKTIPELPKKQTSESAFETVVTTLHTGMSAIVEIGVENFPQEKVEPKTKDPNAPVKRFLADFPMYDSSKGITVDKPDARFRALKVYLANKKVYPTNSDANSMDVASRNEQVVLDIEKNFQALIAAYCQFIVQTSKYGIGINQKINKFVKDKSDASLKKAKERRIFTPEDYSKARIAGDYNPMSDLISLYGIKEAPIIHVNYLRDSLSCQVYAIALFNQFYNNAFKYDYSNLPLTPEWLVNKTGYFEYGNFISLIDTVSNRWEPNGTPSSSISTSYLRRNILHYKNGVMPLDTRLAGNQTENNESYVKKVTVTDENNYTQKFSAFRKLGAVHESLVQSIREDGEPSQADLLSARLELVPKLRAIAKLLRTQYNQWVAQSKSEISTKYNVYVSDLKETLKNISRIRNSLFSLGVDIEKDKALIEFFETQITENEAEQRLRDQTINSLLQENRALESEKSQLTSERQSKATSTNPVDSTRVQQIDARITAIDGLLIVNANLADNVIPAQILQLEQDRQGYITQKKALEKQVVEKKDSIDPRIKANSEAQLKAELERENNKKIELEKKIEVFLKYFNDSVGKYMGVVFSSKKYSSAAISYFNLLDKRDVSNTFDITSMVTYNANHFGNKGERGNSATYGITYTEFFLPQYKTSVDSRGIALKEGEFSLSYTFPPEINSDKGLVVEDISPTLRTGFDASIDVVLLSNFKKVPPLVVALLAIQKKIENLLDAEKRAKET